MVNLGQKIKLLKTCEKRLLNHIIFDLYKKRMEKTANTWEMRGFENCQKWQFLKLGKMATKQRKKTVAKNMRKTTLESHNIWSIQKMDLKNS